MVDGLLALRQSQSMIDTSKSTVNANQGADFRNQLLEEIQNRKQEIAQMVKNGDTEESFQIGGSSLTIKEWEKLMKKVDHQIDSMKEIVEEEAENKKEEAIERVSIDKKLQNVTENQQ